MIPIGALIANQLTVVNTKLKDLSNAKRQELEHLLSDITFKQFELLADHIRLKKKELFEQIAFALEKTCEYHNYDKHQLLDYLRIDSILSFKASMKSGERLKVNLSSMPYLEWNGDPKLFTDFMSIFKERGLATSNSSIFKLFKKQNTPLEIQLNVLKADLILQFFQYLKLNKLVSIIPKGSIYDVLMVHVLDFEKDFLKYQTPKARMNVLKNSHSKWNENQQLILKWTKGIV